MERVQIIRHERGREDKNVGNIKIIELQRKVKEILEIIDQKLARDERKVVARTLEIAEILYNNGIDLEHLPLSNLVNGIREYTRILDIRQDGIDIARIIEENVLDGNLKIGDSIGKLRAIYNGKKNITMTEEEKRKAEALGLIPRQIARKQEKNRASQGDNGESLKELEEKLQELVAKKKASSQLLKDFEGLKKQKDDKRGMEKE